LLGFALFCPEIAEQKGDKRLRWPSTPFCDTIPDLRQVFPSGSAVSRNSEGLMKINVFEGGRRVALMLEIVWVIGCMIVFWHDTPYIELTYETAGPSAPFVRTSKFTDSRDAQEYHGAYDLSDDKRVYVTLCFKAHPFSNGSMLVPYKLEGGQWWGDEPSSSEVTNYTKARSEQFTLSEEARASALAEWRRQRLSRFWTYLGVAFAGWLAIAVVAAILGWIVRGFLGIPRGKDTAGPIAS
jgi:hypothetical protein